MLTTWPPRSCSHRRRRPQRRRDLAGALRLGSMRLGAAAAGRARVRRPHAQPAGRARLARTARRVDGRRTRQHRAGQAAVDDPHRQQPGRSRSGRPPAARHRWSPGRGRPHRRRPARCSPRTVAGATAWLARRLAELTADERALLRDGRPAARSVGVVVRRLTREVDVLRAAHPQLPAVRRRVAGVEHRHLDAARRPGLAGPRAHRQRGALGITTGLQFLPMVLFSPIAGVFADRYSKRRVIGGAQIVLGATAALLGVLAVTGWVAAWHVYVIAFVFGTAAAFDTPARQAFVNEMVPRDQLPNAVGLELGVVQPRADDRPGAGRAAHRLAGLGRRRHRLGDPAQRGELRRGASCR